MTAEPVRSRRLARLCCGLASVAVLATSACAAGQRAQTADQKPTLDGTEASVGQIDLRDIAIEAPGSSTYYAPGASARLRIVLVNNGHSTDRLTSITSSAFRGWASYASPADATIAQQGTGTATNPTASRSIAIGANAATSWGVPDSNLTLVLSGMTKRLYAGNQITMTFTFAHAGHVNVVVPVALTSNPTASYVPEPKNPDGSATA